MSDQPSSQEEAKQFHCFCEEDVIALRQAGGRGWAILTLACACGAIEQDMLSLFDKSASAKIPDELVVTLGEVKSNPRCFSSSKEARPKAKREFHVLFFDRRPERGDGGSRDSLGKSFELVGAGHPGFHETAET